MLAELNLKIQLAIPPTQSVCGMEIIMILENIQPEEVFKYFEQICSIPHGSGNVERISNYCVSFAKEHGLKYRQDEKYNIIIWKNASQGYENAKPVIIQGHLDMVAVKEDGCDIDMNNQGLDIYIDGDYIKARGTTLGADDGIAVAYALAILADDNIKHPALEVVFTVDEEVGMLGAAAIDLSGLKSNTMLNIDSEDEGIFLAGCAGGARLDIKIPVVKDTATGYLCEIKLSGLEGGHSGTEIVSQKANANVLAGRVLSELSKETAYELLAVSGGEKDNAIAAFSKIQIVVPENSKDKVKKVTDELNDVIKKEFEVTDPDIKISAAFTEEKKKYDVLDGNSLDKVILALNILPNGVQKMSNDIKGLVQTSLNLGFLNTYEDSVKLSYLVRSSLGSEKDFLIEKIKGFVRYIGGEISVSGDYPAWEFKSVSPLRDLFVKCFEKLYEKKPVVETIHAGVECGILAGKINDLDCISFGPDIFDIHTTKEKLSISSVERTWKLILEVLKQMKL